jgi:hypothetical protein
MKKFIIGLFLLLLTSCQQVPSTIASPTMKAFEVNDNCPHICWLGINPGVSTEAEAKRLLSNSKEFDETQSYPEEMNINGIRTYWFSGKGRTYPVIVSVAFENGLVTELNFLNMPYSVQDFINILGEPEKISIQHEVPPDNAAYIEYVIYYPSRKIIAWVFPGSDNGPSPEDHIYMLILNIDIEAADIPFWLANSNKNQQPWLGYGHLKDYLPEVDSP